MDVRDVFWSKVKAVDTTGGTNKLACLLGEYAAAKDEAIDLAHIAKMAKAKAMLTADGKNAEQREAQVTLAVGDLDLNAKKAAAVADVLEHLVIHHRDEHGLSQTAFDTLLEKSFEGLVAEMKQSEKPAACAAPPAAA